MLVHRIKTTLLIDDFDFQKFYYKSAEVEWLSKNVVQECVFGSFENEVSNFLIFALTNTLLVLISLVSIFFFFQEKCIPKERKSRTVLQQENLFSKFLHHSLKHLEKQEPEELKTEKISRNENSSSSVYSYFVLHSNSLIF